MISKVFMAFSCKNNLAYLHQTNPRKYRHIKRRSAIPNFREGMKTSCNWTWLLIQAVSNLCWHMFCITICVFGATCLEVKHVTIIIEEYLSVVFYFILSQITLCSIQRKIYWVKYITSIDKVWMFMIPLLSTLRMWHDLREWMKTDPSITYYSCLFPHSRASEIMP